MKLLFFSFLLITVLLFTKAVAQPELDTSFNGSGVQTISFGLNAYATDLVFQPDQKIVAVGRCGNQPGTKSCAARYNDDGSLDTLFGTQGVVQTALDFGTDLRAVALQQDGKIIGAGSVTLNLGTDPVTAVVLIRYNPDGTLDGSFGSGGIVKTQVGQFTQINSASDIVLQSDGKILITANSTFNPPVPGMAVDSQGYVVRYLPNGTLDTSFGNGGVYRMTMNPRTLANGIALQNDGRILIGGGINRTNAALPAASLLVRLNNDGSLDTAWSDDGVLTFEEPSSSKAPFMSVAIQHNGQILGVTITNKLYRINGDGSLDTTFNGTGYNGAALEPGPSNNPTRVVPLAGGRIMILGWLAANNYGFSRFSPDGSLDNTFSGDGRLQVSLSSNPVFGNSEKVDAYGRIVAIGEADKKFGLVRLIAAPPVPVSVSGRVTRSNGNPVSNILLSLTHNGATIATARTSPFGYYIFSNVMTGQDYTVLIKARGSLFTPQALFVADDVAGLDFVEGAPSTRIEGTKGALVR